MKLFSTSKKLAVTLTYVSIIVQALSTLLLTSFYLRVLGEETYGLYQMINAVAQYILILDLGISTVMVRYLAEFEAKEQHEKSENFALHFGIIVLGVIAAITLLGVVVNSHIEHIYRNLTIEEYRISHRMFTFIIVQLVFTVAGHFFQGVSFAYEQYAFEKLISIVQICINTVLVILLIRLGMGVLGIVVANSAVIVLHTLISAFYALFAVRFRIRFHGWDFSMLRPAFLLMLAMLLQAVVGHVNSSVDKTILGIMAAKTDVAVYAVAATVITMFNTLPTAISSVFQPAAVRLVAAGSSGEQLTDFVIRPGRLQFMIMGGFIAGFFLLGRDFLVCWTNRDMLPAWGYVLLILIPNAVPLMQNTCLSVLNAMDKRMARSLILFLMTAVNIGMTIGLIRMVGPIGAPLATGVSYVIGHGLLMNLYYQKRIGLNVARMFREILHGSWLCVLLALAVNYPLMLWRADGSWAVLLAKAAAFCAVYALLLWMIGMNADEKQMVLGMLKSIELRRGTGNDP